MINQYNLVMVKGNKEITKNDFIKLERSVRQLTSALGEHINYLGKHISAMENLTHALKQLDATVKKEIRLESQQPSLQLKEAVSSFVEYYINPRYYRDTSFLQLKAAPPIVHPRPSNVNHVKDNDVTNQEMDNLYILALKKALKDFKEQN